MKAEDWIKVEDGLPNYEEDVLVYHWLEGVIRAYYDKEEGWMSSEYGLLDDVTHWMPLVLPKW